MFERNFSDPRKILFCRFVHNIRIGRVLVAFLRSQEQVRLLSESATAAEEAVNTTMMQYQEGKVDFNRVFDLQIFLAQQQDLQVQASGEVVNSLIEIYRALGGGWQIRYNREPTPTIEPLPTTVEMNPVLPVTAPAPPTSPLVQAVR